MVLLTRYQASRPTRPTTTIWNTQPRITGSFQGATLVRGVEPSASTAIGYFPCRRAMRAPLSLSIGVSVRGNRPLTTLSLPSTVLADRRRVLQAALGPQIVQAAVDFQHRAGTDVALEALAVVPDLLDDVVDPLLVDPQRLAHARCDAEDALDAGILALQHLVDVLRIDAVLFGLHHGVLRPAHDVGELVVAMAHGRCERLLG